MPEDMIWGPRWASKASGQHATLPEDLAGELMCSRSRELRIDQGGGIGYVGGDTTAGVSNR